MPKSNPAFIGRYRVEKKIGQGEMGVVYLAHDDLIDRQVAIKSIRMEKISSDKERSKNVERFFNEARIIGKLDHAHITSIYDLGTEGDVPFLVMEYVDGKTIKQMMNGDTEVSQKDKLRLISMIARGLHYAHRRGVLHRDIKPSNIMIMPNMFPKIMDFGIALFWRGEEPDESLEKSARTYIHGTPFFMSPEQIRGQDLDQRTDVFSLGVTAFEWLSGEKPFPGKDAWEIMRAIVKKKPLPLANVSTIDTRLEEIIFKALEKDLHRRYASAELFSDAIEIYLSDSQKKISEHIQPVATSFSDQQRKTVELLRKKYLFFSDFTQKELFAIFQLANQEQYDKGDVIIREGTSDTTMYIILKGRVAIQKEGSPDPVLIKKLKWGECFGEMSFVDNLPRSASVIAVAKTRVVAINEAVLRHTKPELCLKLYRNLAASISERLRDTDSTLQELLAEKENPTSK